MHFVIGNRNDFRCDVQIECASRRLRPNKKFAIVPMFCGDQSNVCLDAAIFFDFENDS